ncbi:MAG: hypothetical protein OXF32_11565 [Anaerolineaceae bacterium]|nr:hypothetical protein [Anaerolineaceae bacterium]
MAERPVFFPTPPGQHPHVEELCFSFVWNPGFAPVQKKKNISALHKAAEREGYLPLLEISTKSDEKLGKRLSAFNLKVHSESDGEIPLECAFQGSKVFEGGGPFTDLYKVDPKTAKRDQRLRTSGALVRFAFEGVSFEPEPKTAFYDWLYIRAIYPHREWLERLKQYKGFTDIEFNPQKSINCQAYSCALFVALMKRSQLDSAVSSKANFLALLAGTEFKLAREEIHESSELQQLSIDFQEEHQSR